MTDMGWNDPMRQFEIEPTDDPTEEDNYKGGTGWVIVAVGPHGAVYMDWDSNFGALRWWLDQGLHDNPEDTGATMPDGTGVYRATWKAWTTTSYEGERDMGFEGVGEWEKLWPTP